MTITMNLPASLLLLVGATVANAQSFLSAAGARPELSQFRQLLTSRPNLAAALTSSDNNGNRTVMAPNNDAFTNYFRYTGQNIESLQSNDLKDLVEYHSLNGALSSSDLAQPNGLAASTGLTDPTYNNLGLGSNGAAEGQKVFVGSGSGGPSQQQARTIALYAQSGLVSNSSINPIDAKWDYGLFHIVDNFFVLPQNQTNTMAAYGVTSFIDALNQTNLTSTFNDQSNFTSFPPINLAFANRTLSTSALAATLQRHATNSSAYTNQFRDGELFYSYNGYPIRVSVVNGSIYLNDAKLIAGNFITKNGAMHVLDRIMGFLNTTTNVTTPADGTLIASTTLAPILPPASTSTSNRTATTTRPSTPAQVTTNAASLISMPQYQMSIVSVVFLALGAVLFR